MYGIDNEYEFVKYLNGKKVKELNKDFKNLIYYLFKNIGDDEIIKSWRNHYKEKTDIFIKATGKMKDISIKKGSRNSVHVEGISYFTSFLYHNNIPIDIINKYLKYHYGDGTLNGKGTIRQSVEKCKEEHRDDIKLINKYFNNTKIIKLVIDRFILKGNNSDFAIDAIVFGTINNFIWLKKEDIYKVIFKQKGTISSAVHFGPLVVQPKTRCLNYNPKYEKDRFCVQIKWYSLQDDIINFKSMLPVDNVGI